MLHISLGWVANTMYSHWVLGFRIHPHTHTHTPIQQPFVRDYPGEPVPEGKTNLDFTEARDSEWQWHQLDHNMQVCTSFQTDNHASTPPLRFYKPDALPDPTNSIKALKAQNTFLSKIYESP